MSKIAYVGVDDHLNHLYIAVMIRGRKKFHDMIRLENGSKYLRKII